MSIWFPPPPDRWEVFPFDEAVRDATGGNPKVKESEALEHGLLPVIDQGQEYIRGYVDDLGLRCRVQLPIVLFGDHTKILKYVTEPFVLGADGVKILKPKAGWDERFIFHYLKTIHLPNGQGYSRHFKFLKRISIPRPPLPEQRRIAAILDKADAIRRKHEQTLALADDFLRSTFLHMFGDPVTNPKGFKECRLGDIGQLERGRSQHRPRNDPSLLGGPYPFIQTGDVARANGIIHEYVATYSEKGLRQSRMWPAGTLCITIAANIAETAILGFDACFPDSVVGFVPGRDSTVDYVQHLLRCLKDIIEAKATRVAQSNINLEILRNLPVPCPPISSQAQYSGIVQQVKRHQASIASQRQYAENLFTSLSQRAFSGDL